MTECQKPFLIDLSQPDGYAQTRGEQIKDLISELSIADLLEILGTECLEIRFSK